MSTMSVCDKRGHYYLPIDLPPQEGAFWSILPPAPQKKLYCRRCGKVCSLTFESVVSSGSSTTGSYKSTNWEIVSATHWSGLVYLGAMDPSTYKKDDV